MLSGCQSLLPIKPTETGEDNPVAADAASNRPFTVITGVPLFPSDEQDNFELETTPASLTVERSSTRQPADAAIPVALAGPETAPPPTPSKNLWDLTRDNFGLDLATDDPRVTAQLNWYKSHPRYISRVVDRAKRYYHHVLHAVIERGMPAEIALLPIVESAYDPFAYSHGRAAGPWQFIPGTARHFGLRKSWWYDGRRDITASTQAALDYLEQLARRFDGDYLLALAGYNAGGGNVSKAMRHNRKKGRPTDFWSLSTLPRETSAYVPKLIALARLFKEPEKYGIELEPLADEPYFAAVDTGGQIDLAQAATLAEISIDELYLLNPGFNQWATDPEGPHQLLVPVAKAEAFQQALAQLPVEKRVNWTRYKIRQGDSLSTIAKAHKTTVQTIRTANNLNDHMIRAGQMLLIPTASEEAKIYAYSAGQRQAKKNQRIALRSGKQKLRYQVKPGDSFWEIAQEHDVGVRELASWNQMAPGDPLRVGKELVIWQAGGQTLASNSDSRNLVRKIGYRVRSGDSFARIASRFNVGVNDIKRWNSKAAQAKYLQPGQRLTLYVDVRTAH
nr:LysM peptidoglycan-binding domain-containing protein [Motiliproteus sp. SC1-56]